MQEEQKPDELEKRKIKLKEYISGKYNLLQYLLLAIIVGLGIYIRSQPLKTLIDQTTGQYISIELDSTLWLRYAEYIAQHGSLYTIDHMRYYPIGAGLKGIGTFTSYIVAYFYKFLNLIGFQYIVGHQISVAYADVIYPITAMAILSVFFFLLIRKLFDWRVGLLGTLILNIIPTFLFRSLGGSSDHDILGYMFIVMAFYFFFAALQSEKLKHGIPLAVVASIISILARKTAGSSTLIFVIFGTVMIIETFTNRFNRKYFYTYLAWIIPIIIYFTFSNTLGGIYNMINSVTTGAAFFALFFAVVYYILYEIKYFKEYTKKINLPPGVFSLILSVILITIIGLIFIGPSFITTKIQQVYTNLFQAFANTRWTLTVAENHKPYVTDWFGQFGRLFVLSFIIGSVLLYYDTIKYLKKAYWLTAAYAVFIFGYIFSRYSTTSVLNGENSISNLLFYGVLLGFVGFMIILYIWSYYKEREEFDSIAKLDYKYTFLFIWFLIMIFAATSAVRLIFEFTPIVAILSSFFIISLMDYSFKLKNQILKYGSLAIILILLLNPFAYAQGILITYYNDTINQARGIGPSYDFQWQQAGKWVRENTPQDAIFAHWWDYGYWVQSGFQRTTITDGGNFYGWWNYLMARIVLTGQTEEEGLGFLYAHNASYLLIVSDDIGKYPAYSSIGSDLNYDRFSSIPAFALDMTNSKETRDGLDAVYRGAVGLDQNFIYKNQLFPAGSTGIFGFIIPIKNANNTIEISRPTALLIYQGQQASVPVNCVYYNDKVINYGNDGYDACLRIIPSIENNQANNIGGLLLLSPKVKNSLFSQLYLMDKKSRYYDLVYSDSRVPLAMFSGRIIGPIRIWKISYPENFKINQSDYQYYTRLDYPDARLMNP